MTFRARVEKLDKIIPPLPVPKPEDRAAEDLVDLLFDAMKAVQFTDEEEARVDASFAEPDKHRNPYRVWVRALREGWCRLPEVTPAIMREIMLAFAVPPTWDHCAMALVCNACGMLLPRDIGPCPICGTGKRPDGI
jgi:hypothetical protein